jgi:flagellar motor protein MotB
MFEHDEQDEGIAWPSYVDFLSTFIFVMIIFIGSLVYILSGDIGDRTFKVAVANTKTALGQAHIDYRLQSKKIYIPLKDQIKFETGCPDATKVSCPKGLSDENVAYLRKVAKVIAQDRGWKQIIIEGRADATQYKDGTGKIDKLSEFKNFDLSTRRAMEVLEFFHDCFDCGYDPKSIRPKLVLSGLGNKNDTGPDQGERRVDVVLDYSGGLQ